MEKTRIQDLVIGLIVAAIGIFGLVKTFSMPEGTQPYTFVVLGVFTFLGGLLAVRSIIYGKTPSPDGKNVTVKEMINPMLAFVMILVYGLLLNKIGFFVTSAVFMLLMMFWMGYRKIHFMLLTTVLMLGFIWVLFVYQLHVTLPRGILF